MTSPKLCLGLLAITTLFGQIHSECFPADVVLVLDDSESIRIYDSVSDSFKFAVDYSYVVRAILANFDPSTVRVSLVTYSQTAVALVGLTRDYQPIIEEVDSYTREYSTQRTNLGIDVAIIELDKARPNVYKYMIVFMDGTSFKPDETKASVIRAGDKNITLISVSLRGALDESYTIAGRSYRRFSVNTPGELASRPDIIQSITNVICNECKGHSDVIYLLDGSDSTRRISNDFSRTFYAPGVIDFIVNVTENVAMGPIRIGIIMYSETVDDVISITGSGPDVITATRNVTPEYLNTMAGLAFRRAMDMFDEAVPKRHADVQRIVVYMVDGTVTNKTDLSIQAQNARDNGIMIFAIGFATAALYDDLMAVGNPEQVTRITSDLDLDEFVNPAVEFLCQNPPSLTSDTSAP